jgi:hypothetical protein
MTFRAVAFFALLSVAATVSASSSSPHGLDSVSRPKIGKRRREVPIVYLFTPSLKTLPPLTSMAPCLKLRCSLFYLHSFSYGTKGIYRTSAIQLINI